MHGLQEHYCPYSSRDYYCGEQYPQCYAPEHNDAHGEEHKDNSGIVDFLASCVGDEHHLPS
jgi:hypothetical protein